MADLALTAAARMRLLTIAVLGCLAVAAPASAQPLGSQQQLSFTEPLEEASISSTNAAVTYGGGRNLVVWQQEIYEEQQEEAVARGADIRTVIMGRFVNGASTPLAAPFAIGETEDGAGFEALPDVAYDAEHDEFLVVWESAEIRRGLSGNAIRGALVRSNGTVTTPSTLLTPETENAFGDPAAAYSPAADAFLVAYGDQNDAVHVRKVGASDLSLDGAPQDITAGNGFGDLGGNLSPRTPQPDVAFDAVSGRWLVVFQAAVEVTGSRGGGGTAEIYGRSFDSALQASGVQRLSHAEGGGLDQSYQTREPSVAADDAGGGFLVVYVGTPVETQQAEGRSQLIEEEIFSRRVNAADATPNGDAHQVTDSPEEGSSTYNPARRPDVWHDNNADQFLATWAQDITGPSEQFRVDGSIEYEVFGKKLDGGGSPLGADTQISSHKPDDGPRFDGDLPAVTYDRAACDYVVGWTGENAEDDDKQEIWGRAYDAPSCPPGRAEEARTASGTRAGVFCKSARNFPIRLVRRKGRVYDVVLVKVNGQPVKVNYGNRIRVQVNLSGLPPGRFSVDIEATLKGGKKLKGVRRYTTCSKRQPPSNGLDREDAL